MSNRDKWLDTLDRVLRTFVQSFIGTFLAIAVVGGVADIPDLDLLKQATLAGVFAGGTAGMSLLMNSLENLKFIPAAGRDVPPPGPVGDA